MGRYVPALLATLAAPAFTLADPGRKPTPAEAEYFEAKVRPVLVEKCVSCHGPKKQMGGLRLDTAAGVKQGADTGPVILPGDPLKSPLVKAVRREGEYAMPPNEALPAVAVAALTEWAKIGGPFPESVATAPVPAAGKDHWAFRPVTDPAVPAAKSVPPAANPIDKFVAAALEKQGLALSPRADARTLVRRAYFDLTGLPPTAEEVAAFEADTSPDAFARVVDRLLASPRYGERWGRYWLDLARYADSKGYVFTEDRNYPYAYTFRDYVIRSLNDDVPYDRFVTEQLAADLLPQGEDKRPLAAMGFLTVGRRFSNNTQDIIDDRIDLVTRGLMGLTVSCARCHDHKFDPIPTADYYSLYGVFASTNEPKELPLIGAVERTPEYLKFEAELAKREKALADHTAARKAGRLTAVMALGGSPLATAKQDKLLNWADRKEAEKFQQKIDAHRGSSPFAPPRAMVVNDNPQPTQPVVFVRGNPGNRGPAVPRQFPAIAAGPARKPFAAGSGRLELAKAVTSPANPLTARVMVNRVWLGHFGNGLVRTPSDFGTRADPPTHPELLDWLATRFATEDGWSLKKLHRRMMLSATYQQSAAASPEAAKRDPENKLLAHQARRRLDFEALRDSMLFAAGTLDLSQVGGRSVDLFKLPLTKRRSVYGLIDRQNLSPTLRAFDVPAPEQHSPQRFQTTVPQQALFLMNSPFIAEQARGVAARVPAGSPTDRVRGMYRAVLGRNPTADEAALAAELAAATPDVKGLAPLSGWEQLAQVLLLCNEFAFAD